MSSPPSDQAGGSEGPSGEFDRDLEHFEQLWWDCKDPDPEDFLGGLDEERAKRLLNALLLRRLSLERDLFPRCSLFEKALKAGRTPAIEDHLDSGKSRRRVLRELLALEFFWAPRQGRRLSPAIYWRRFPGDLDVVAEAFSRTFRPQSWRFRTVGPIGSGAFGRISEVEDVEFGKRAALKEVREDKAKLATHQLRLEEEARITAMLEHPGVVPVYARGRNEKGQPFFVMELVRGGDFTGLIGKFHRRNNPSRLDRRHQLLRRKGRFRAFLPKPDDYDVTSRPLRRLLGIFRSVCTTVAYAHSRNVIHRDLKPKNIRIGDFDAVMVMDWGLAEDLGRRMVAPVSTDDPPGSSSYRRGEVIGTLAYMSPEQARGRHEEVTPVSDVFSLGAILFEILTGLCPIDTISDDRILRAIFDLIESKAIDAARMEEKVGSSLPVAGVDGPVAATIFDRIGRLLPTWWGDDEQSLIAEKVVIKIAEVGEYSDARVVNHRVHPGLAAICAKALAASPKDRYQDASVLGEEVARWLDDEEIEAYDEPRLSRVARWLRRNRAATRVAASVVLASAACLAALIFVKVADRERRIAREFSSRTEGYIDKTFNEIDRLNAIAGRMALHPGAPTGVDLEQLVETYANEDVRKMRGKLLEEALRFYEEISSSLETDHRLFFLNETRVRIARIHNANGVRDDAKRTFLEAIDGFEKLRDEDSANPDYLLHLSAAYHDLGSIHYEARDLMRAIEAFRKARELRTELLHFEPNNVEYQILVARSDGYIGDLVLAEGNVEEATSYYRSSHEIRSAHSKRSPDDPDAAYELARSHNNLGQLALAEGQPGQALNEHFLALGILDQVLKKLPEPNDLERTPGGSGPKPDLPRPKDDYQSDRAWTRIMIARAHGARRGHGDLKAVMANLEEALSQFADLSLRNPLILDYQSGGATALLELAEACPDGEDKARRAATVFAKLANINKDDPTLRNFQARALRRLGVLLRHRAGAKMEEGIVALAQAIELQDGLPDHVKKQVEFQASRNETVVEQARSLASRNQSAALKLVEAAVVSQEQVVRRIHSNSARRHPVIFDAKLAEFREELAKLRRSPIPGQL